LPIADAHHKAEFYEFFQPKFISSLKEFHFMGFTSTLIGISESFLPHLGHFPLC